MPVRSTTRTLPFVALAAFVVVPTALFAQGTPDLTAAASAISPEAIARHVSVLTADSMQSRDTPSPGLEKTARYIAAQFQAAGLKPAGQHGTWFQRYLLPRDLDFGRSRVVFTAGGRTAVTDFATAALLVGRGELQSIAGAVTLLAGRRTVEQIRTLDLGQQIVLYVPPATLDAVTQEQTATLLRARSRAVIMLSSADSAGFARRIRLVTYDNDRRPSENWGAIVRPEAVTDLRAVLAAGGVDLARMQADTAPVLRAIPALHVAVDFHFDRPAEDTTTAPNVVGVLEGRDTSLATQYVLMLAHMDQAGVTPGRPDSVAVGADDNAAGVAGLLELARVFNRPDARPARSIVFLAVSGGVKGLSGSEAFGQLTVTLNSAVSFLGVSPAELMRRMLRRHPGTTSVWDIIDTSSTGFGDMIGIGMTSAMVAINLDRIGRAMGDSVAVDGVHDADFAVTPAWVAAAHSELGLRVLDSESAVQPTSDHFSLVRHGVPSLFFHNADGKSHERGERAGAPITPTPDLPSAIDPERTARLVRLVFYTSHRIAEARQSPRWTADGRRRFLEAAP